MNRRNLIGRLGALAVGGTAFRFPRLVQGQGSPASPHAEAISLVIERNERRLPRRSKNTLKRKALIGGAVSLPNIAGTIQSLALGPWPALLLPE
jgi:hypothetical protein